MNQSRYVLTAANDESLSSKDRNRTTGGMSGSAVTKTFFMLCLLLVVGVDPSNAQGFDPKPEDFLPWVANITDPTMPLPTCEMVGAFEALTCSALCEAIDGGEVVLDETRDVDGGFICTCTSQVACNDRPTCSQLTIQPGSVEETCTSICGNERIMAVIDEIEFSNNIMAANRDMTHFVMECRCDGDVQCSDYVLFSDIDIPTTCTSLSITDQAGCDDYCATAGGGLFDLNGNFTILTEDVAGYCSCMATNLANATIVDIAMACTDIPVDEGTLPCSLAEGPGCRDEKPSGGGGGAAGLSSAMQTPLINTASIIAITASTALSFLYGLL